MTTYTRDLKGYGANPPQANWPNGARVALSLVLNYEEGAEYSIEHDDAHSESILSDLVKRYTRMQVFEVTDGMKVASNCAYIIPPNCDMAFANGALTLSPPAAPRSPSPAP